MSYRWEKKEKSQQTLETMLVFKPVTINGEFITFFFDHCQ